MKLETIVKEVAGPGKGDLVIEFFKTTEHTNARLTSSTGKAIMRSIASGQPGNFCIPYTDEKTITLVINDREFIDTVLDLQKQGKHLIVKFPRLGIPAYPGKDAIEFQNGIKGKRINRWNLKANQNNNM